MSTAMREDYARALRAALVDHVQRQPPARARVARPVAVTAGCLAALLTGAGLAAAAGVFDPPGRPDARQLTPGRTAEATGPDAVALGVAPLGTNAVELTLTCLTAGTFTSRDGTALTCGPDDAGKAAATWPAPALPGPNDTAIRAGTGERRRLTTSYSTVTTTRWGVNSDGQTFGVENGTGTPDLIAVIATNGRGGYVYSQGLAGPPPDGLVTSPAPAGPGELPVYDSDGRTQVGVLRLH